MIDSAELESYFEFCSSSFDGKTHLVSLPSPPHHQQSQAPNRNAMATTSLKNTVRELEASLLNCAERSDMELLKEEGQKMVSQLPSVNNAR